MIKLKDLLKEGKDDDPKPGDRVALVVSSRYVQHILAIKRGYAIVDNKYHKKAPGVILQKKGKKLDFYKKSFKIKLSNLKAKGTVRGKTLWYLKRTRDAIDGKDLEFAPMGRGTVFGYVEV